MAIPLLGWLVRRLGGALLAGAALSDATTRVEQKPASASVWGRGPRSVPGPRNRALLPGPRSRHGNLFP